jgi:hypothetical protein
MQHCALFSVFFGAQAVLKPEIKLNPALPGPYFRGTNIQHHHHHHHHHHHRLLLAVFDPPIDPCNVRFAMPWSNHSHSFRLAVQPLQRTWNLAATTFQRHPFLIKTLSSGVGFAVGDGLTQLGLRRGTEPYDWERTGKMGAAGLAVAGPVGYLFILWMEGNIMIAAPAR